MNGPLYKYLTDPSLPGGVPCRLARETLVRSGLTDPVDVVAACPRGDWLLWLAARIGVDSDTLVTAVRPAILRAARVHAANAFDAAGLHEQADRLRGIADDAPFADIAATAHTAAASARLVAAVEAVTAGAWVVAAASVVVAATSVVLSNGARAAHAAAAWSACAADDAADAWAPDAAYQAATAAQSAPNAAASEHAQCADDVRTAIPRLGTLLRDAVARHAI